MSKRSDIAEQIRKYLNGELDARAMHELERRAQDDPFLMDALEGYENAETGQDKNLQELSDRLHRRIYQRERRIIPIRIIAIAASLLLAISISLYLFMNRKAAPQIQSAKISSPVIKKKDSLVAMEPAIQKAITGPKLENALPPAYHKRKKHSVSKPVTMAIAADAEVAEPPVGNADKVAEAMPAPENKNMQAAKVQARKDSIPMNELIVMNYKAANQVYQLSGKVAGVATNVGRVVKGTVKDDSGSPIPGATVAIAGKPIAAVTDAQGKFSLNGVTKGSELNINFIGYNAAHVKLNSADSSLVIAMQPNTSSLDEVVVVGYGTKKKDLDNQYQSARPFNGWDEYRKYLKDNAQSPDGKAGVVKLSFIINANNSLSAFKVTRSISVKTDSAAVNLVKYGPAWRANSNGKPKKVKLRIRFSTKADK